VLVWYDGESGKGRRNRFDTTAACDTDDFCYNSTNDVQHYLNLPHIPRALHIDPSMPSYRNYSIASTAVGQAFQISNDLGIGMEAQVQNLLSSQIDGLVYQGNLDLACNIAGSLRWANNTRWKGRAEFATKRLEWWGLLSIRSLEEMGNRLGLDVLAHLGSPFRRDTSVPRSCRPANTVLPASFGRAARPLQAERGNSFAAPSPALAIVA
jgi:carboxypeptidase C (cathepsin A)